MVTVDGTSYPLSMDRCKNSTEIRTNGRALGNADGNLDPGLSNKMKAQTTRQVSHY